MAVLLLTNHLRNYSRAYQFAEDIYRLASNEKLKDLLMAPKMEIIREATKDLQELHEASQEFGPEFQFADPVTWMAEEFRQNIDNYPQVVINQTLSILCSLFEAFLVEGLDTIMEMEPRTVIDLAEQKEIALKDVVRLGDYPKIIESFKAKIIKSFSMDKTVNQFRCFKKLKFSIDAFFDLSNRSPEVQETYKGWNLSKLSSIFEERHMIVHRGGGPLSNLADLHLRKVFFEEITINITKEIRNRFNVSIR